MLGDPTFFARSLPFDSFHYNKKQTYLYVGSFNYFSFTIHIGAKSYMDTGVHDLKVALF